MEFLNGNEGNVEESSRRPKYHSSEQGLVDVRDLGKFQRALHVSRRTRIDHDRWLETYKELKQ